MAIEKITVVHVRDPDSDCSIELFDQDGDRIPVDVSVIDVDPGRGYDVEDWDENTEWYRQNLPAGSALQAAALEAYGDPPRGGVDYIAGWREKHEEEPA